MKVVISLLLLLSAIGWVDPATARPGPRWHQLQGYTFERYVADFNKDYAAGSPEWNHRRGVFEGRLADIMAHNGDTASTFKMGVNQFTDTTDEERRALNAARRPDPNDTKPVKTVRAPSGYAAPRRVDYRNSIAPRVLTGIKFQGFCGNCWATAATEAMESYYALLTGELHVLSQQQITSCTNMTGCWKYEGMPIGGGCGGGMAEHAFAQIPTFYKGGLLSLWEYPFVDFYAKNMTMEDTSPCRTVYHKRTPLPEATATGFNYVHSNDAESTMYALAEIGPLAIYVAAGNWFSYETGVYHNLNPDPTNGANFETDHVVQLVGYGHDDTNGEDYWIVRNSWGAHWGEDGFIRLRRPKVEPCGLDSPDFLSCSTNGTKITKGQMACGTSSVLVQPLYPLVARVSPNK